MGASGRTRADLIFCEPILAIGIAIDDFDAMQIPVGLGPVGLFAACGKTADADRTMPALREFTASVLLHVTSMTDFAPAKQQRFRGSAAIF